jgi:phosphotransferase system HPr (HPr) family protein
MNTQTFTTPLIAGMLLAEQELDRHFHRPVLKLEKEITIVNRFGLHMRPAAIFARNARRFCSDVRVVKNGDDVDGKSVMSLLSLGAAPGTRLQLRIEGRDAKAAMSELEQLVQEGFDEDAI